LFASAIRLAWKFMPTHPWASYTAATVLLQGSNPGAGAIMQRSGNAYLLLLSVAAGGRDVFNLDGWFES
jgi:hypothetical protein